ncbi:hypothetical protein P0963_12135 [Xanthomonas hortorum pv. gardneri]|nr:hypothetical protein [Xanthomonas hortorum]
MNFTEERGSNAPNCPGHAAAHCNGRCAIAHRALRLAALRRSGA